MILGRKSSKLNRKIEEKPAKPQEIKEASPFDEIEKALEKVPPLGELMTDLSASIQEIQTQEVGGALCIDSCISLLYSCLVGTKSQLIAEYSRRCFG